MGNYWKNLQLTEASDKDVASLSVFNIYVGDFLRVIL